MTKTSQTLQIFDDAPYQTEFTARVVEIRETAIALDKTLFYPTGGYWPPINARWNTHSGERDIQRLQKQESHLA